MGCEKERVRLPDQSKLAAVHASLPNEAGWDVDDIQAEPDRQPEDLAHLVEDGCLCNAREESLLLTQCF